MSKRTRNEGMDRASRGMPHQGKQTGPVDRYYQRMGERSAKARATIKRRQTITLPKINLPE